MSDVRTLLHETAALPTRGPDLGAARREARARRRRHRGLAGGLGVLVVVGATVGAVRIADDGGASTRVAIGPRQSSDVPDGWTPVEVDPGIRLAIPPGWSSYDFGTSPVAERRIAVGTARPSGDAVMMACTPELGQLPTETGIWVGLWEYPDLAGSEVPEPAGAGDILGIADRPADFRTREPFSSCPVAATDLTASFAEIAFRDAGRVFVARVVTAYPTGDAPDLTEGLQVLNTLRISPLETTTTFPATTTTIPVTTTTMAAPFVPTTDNEQRISDLVVTWLRDQNDDEIRATIEDADSILGAMHEGMRQYSSNLPKYSGYANSVEVVDADHAVIDYTLLLDGAPLWGRRTGAAIKIDGVWKVSRDTECSLLAVGSIMCPPRSSP
jgi:hypothetical protein